MAATPQRVPILHGYVRVSTKGQAIHGKSLEEQEQQIRAFYAARGGENFALWGDIYRDAGVSAAKTAFTKRPAGSVLAQRLKKGDHIVVTSLDRCFRNFREAVDTVDDWMKAGINIHWLDFSVSTDNVMGKGMMRMLMVIAQLQRDMAADRTSAVVRMQRLAGKTPWFDRELGWKIEGPKGHRKLVPDEEARETIRLIARLHDAGNSFENICIYLIENRVRHLRKGKEWSFGSVRRAYYYHKHNPEFRRLKPDMIQANGGRALGREFQKVYGKAGPTPAETVT